MERGLRAPITPRLGGNWLGATEPWQNRSRTKKNKPALNTKLRILPAQPQRLLADEFQPHRATSAQQPLAGTTGSSRHAHIADQTSLRAKSPSLIGTAGADPLVRWCGTRG